MNNETNGQAIQEPSRRIPVIDEVDVLVVGGGPAGVCAAVAASQAGMKTLLIERYGFLGGMWTAGLVLTLAGFNSWLRPYHRCVNGIAGDWLRRAAAIGSAEDNASWALNTEPEGMKLVADAMLEEAGVQCLLHTWYAMPILDGKKIKGGFIENVDGRSVILAKMTIDCTGNGDIIARSGASWVKGRTLQPMTMPFRIGGVSLDPSIDHRKPVQIPIGPEPILLQEPLLSEYAPRRHDVTWDQEGMRDAKQRGEIPLFGGPWFGGLDKDIVWVNATRIIGDASKASEFTRAEIEGRKNVFTLMSYFREHLKGFEHARLLQTSPQIGVRETRRLIGLYTLTGSDVREARRFDDSIGVGCWPIDIHPVHDVGVHELYVPLPFGIPYRCLVPHDVGNLLTAGRCISVDREAQSSIRVGATCAVTGHAAGAVAATAIRRKVQPCDIDKRRLRDLLTSQNAIIDPPG